MPQLNVFLQTTKICHKNAVWWILADDINHIVVKSPFFYPAVDWLNAVISHHKNAVEKLKLFPAVCESLGFDGVFFNKNDISLLNVLTLLKEAQILDFQFISKYDEKGKIVGDLGYLIHEKSG